MFQPFNILFYKGRTPISRIIRHFSKPYSHVALILDHFHSLESSWKHKNIILHTNYKYRNYDIYRLNIELSEIQKYMILKFIKEHIRSKYDFLYLITRGLHLLLGTPIKNSKKSYTCDELIVEAFKYAGIHLVDGCEMLTPSYLAKSKYLTKITL